MRSLINVAAWRWIDRLDQYQLLVRNVEGRPYVAQVSTLTTAIRRDSPQCRAYHWPSDSAQGDWQVLHRYGGWKVLLHMPLCRVCLVPWSHTVFTCTMHRFEHAEEVEQTPPSGGSR